MKNIKKKYDLVVIGGGPAGTPVAIEYAKLNHEKSIALIDALGDLGGECLFQGCIPSKIMEASARHIKELDSFKNFGIELEDPHFKLIWEKIKQRKDDILTKRTEAAKTVAFDVGNIDLIKGFASFEDEKSIKVTLEDFSTHVISFEKAVIGTGSKARVFSYDGNACDSIMTNDEFFHEMYLPKSLSIIGGGAIAIEFTQILSSLGVEINLFVRGERILKNIDDEASSYITENLQKNKNINLLLNSTIQRVDHKDDMLEITFLQNDKEKSLVCEKILSATGRKPNLEKLALEKANIDFNKNGIVTTDFLQTTNKNVFANGDVVEGFPKFAHTAQYAAHTVAQNLFLEHNFFKPDFTKNSWVLFSMPNFASSGISEKEAKDKSIEVIVDRFDFSTEAKSQIENEDFGYLKYIVEKKTQKIIGISILHSEANMIAGEAALIVGRRLTLKEVIDTIHPHPTLSEAFVSLAKKIKGDIMLEKMQNPVIQALLKCERLI